MISGRGRPTWRRLFVIVAFVGMPVSASGQEQEDPKPVHPPASAPHDLPAPADQDSPAPPPEREDPAPPPPVSGVAELTLRSGAWFLPAFRATIAGGSREFSSRALFDVGVDASMPAGPLRFAVSADYAEGGRIRAVTASVLAGLRLDVGGEVDVRLWGGPAVSFLEHEEAAFGAFDGAFGALTRAEASVRVADPAAVSVWADVRWIEYDYREDVIRGDRSAGGGMFAVGASLQLRF